MEDMGTYNGTKMDESAINVDDEMIDPSWEPAQLKTAYEKSADDDDSTSTKQYDWIISAYIFIYVHCSLFN